MRIEVKVSLANENLIILIPHEYLNNLNPPDSVLFKSKLSDLFSAATRRKFPGEQLFVIGPKVFPVTFSSKLFLSGPKPPNSD